MRLFLFRGCVVVKNGCDYYKPSRDDIVNCPSCVHWQSTISQCAIRDKVLRKTRRPWSMSLCRLVAADASSGKWPPGLHERSRSEQDRRWALNLSRGTAHGFFGKSASESFWVVIITSSTRILTPQKKRLMESPYCVAKKGVRTSPDLRGFHS